MSASGATAPLIVSIPNIRIANPRRILPISFFLELFLQVIVIIMPITASTGENDDGFKRLIHPAPLIPVSDNIHEVTVVPILAPIIIPTACESCIIPELTKPTTITVVADESPMTFIPYRNKARPPTIVNTPKISILHKLLFHSTFSHIMCILNEHCKMYYVSYVKFM